MVKKVELHSHLEGTANPELIRQLAKRNRVTLPETLFTKDGKHFQWNDFLEFLQCYELASSVIKQPEDYFDITYDYLKRCAAEDTIYIETMYSPEHAERSSGIASHHHLEAISAALQQARADFGIIGNIIATAVRHYGVDAVEKVAREAAERQFDCITGFGLGGDEANFPPILFKKAYDIAHQSGLACTVHAGEMDGPKSIQQALDTLPVTRLGHGVRCIEDSSIKARIKNENIHLEICPCSNLATKVFTSMEEHPFPQLFKEGFNVSLSSDDPPYFHTTIGNEYHIAKHSFGLDDKSLQHVTEMGINAAFTSNDTKAFLKAQLE